MDRYGVSCSNNITQNVCYRYYIDSYGFSDLLAAVYCLKQSAPLLKGRFNSKTYVLNNKKNLGRTNHFSELTKRKCYQFVAAVTENNKLYSIEV